MDCQIVKALPIHAWLLSRDMRDADRAEVLASGGYSPLEALVDSLHASAEAYTFLVRCQVAACFGVVPIVDNPAMGAIWLLTGTPVDKHPLAFLRHCRPQLEAMQSRWPTLVNAIDARHTKALRWAAWLGFDVAPATPFGDAGLPFHRIHRTRGNAPCASPSPLPP